MKNAGGRRLRRIDDVMEPQPLGHRHEPGVIGRDDDVRDVEDLRDEPDDDVVLIMCGAGDDGIRLFYLRLLEDIGPRSLCVDDGTVERLGQFLCKGGVSLDEYYFRPGTDQYFGQIYSEGCALNDDHPH